MTTDGSQCVSESETRRDAVVRWPAIAALVSGRGSAPSSGHLPTDHEHSGATARPAIRPGCTP